MEEEGAEEAKVGNEGILWGEGSRVATRPREETRSSVLSMSQSLGLPRLGW